MRHERRRANRHSSPVRAESSVAGHCLKTAHVFVRLVLLMPFNKPGLFLSMSIVGLPLPRRCKTFTLP